MTNNDTDQMENLIDMVLYKFKNVCLSPSSCNINIALYRNIISPKIINHNVKIELKNQKLLLKQENNNYMYGVKGIEGEYENIHKQFQELQKSIKLFKKINKDLEENNKNLQKQQDELTNEYDNKKNELSIIEQEYEDKVKLIASLENRIKVLEADIKNMRAELYGLNRLKEYTDSISLLISSFNESINKVTYNEHQNDETAQYRSAYCIEQTKYNLQKKIFIGSLDDLIKSKDNTQKTIIQYTSPSWNKFEYLWYSGLEELWYLAHENKTTDYLFIIRNCNLSIIESYAGILLDIYMDNRKYNPIVKEDRYAYMPTNLYIMFVPVNNDEKYEYSLPINPQLIETVNNIG